MPWGDKKGYNAERCLPVLCERHIQLRDGKNGLRVVPQRHSVTCWLPRVQQQLPWWHLPRQPSVPQLPRWEIQLVDWTQGGQRVRQVSGGDLLLVDGAQGGERVRQVPRRNVHLVDGGERVHHLPRRAILPRGDNIQQGQWQMPRRG